MSINENHDEAQAQEILDAMRTIQDSPELKAEAQTNPDKVMDRLGLAGIARHAVAFAITAAVFAPVASSSHIIGLQGVWR